MGCNLLYHELCKHHLRREIPHFGVICFTIKAINPTAKNSASFVSYLFYHKVTNIIAKINASCLCHLLYHQIINIIAKAVLHFSCYLLYNKIINTIAKSNISFFVLSALSPNYKHHCKEQCLILESSVVSAM